MKEKILFFLFFLVTYFTGLYFSQDYGISWDETIHQHWGAETYSIILDFINFSVINNFNHFDFISQGPGVWFDLLTAFAADKMDLESTQEIYSMRHAFTFSIYFIGCIGFFLFSKIVFKDNTHAMIATFFYLLHPRLLGNGFYNFKDSILQAMIAISLFPIAKAFLTHHLKWICISAFLMGISIATRVIAIYIPVIFLMLFVIKIFIEKDFHRKWFLYFFFFIISVFTGIIIGWPTIIEDPFYNIIRNFNIMKNAPWDGAVFFFGEYVQASKLAWYYIPVWFIITTPIIYLFLLFTGLIIFIRNSSCRKKYNIFIYLFMLCGLLVPFLSILYFSSTLYDGWRHMFFVYPFCAFFMYKGFIFAIVTLKKTLRLGGNTIMIIGLILVFSAPVISIINLHPHQQIYFNAFAGKDPMQKFEGDYWGTSYYQGLNWLCEHSKFSVAVWAPHSIAYNNTYLLDSELNKKIKFIKIGSLQECIEEVEGMDVTCYYMTNFRYQQDFLYNKSDLNQYPFNNEVYTISKGGMKILGIYKMN